MPLKLNNEADLKQARAAFFNSTTQKGWVLLNFTGSSTVKLSLAGKGAPEDLALHLEDDRVQYGLVRVPISSSSPSSSPRRRRSSGSDSAKSSSADGFRDIMVTWVGEEVEDAERQQKGSFEGEVERLLQPFDARVTVYDRSRFHANSLLAISDPKFSGRRVI